MMKYGNCIEIKMWSFIGALVIFFVFSFVFLYIVIYVLMLLDWIESYGEREKHINFWKDLFRKITK